MRLILAGFVLLLSASCQRPAPVSVFIDPALATMVPGGTYQILGLKLDKLTTTPLYKKYIANRPIELLDKFHEQTGIDARKDLFELLMCQTDGGPLALVKGKFSDVVGRAPNIQFGGTAPSMYKGLMLLGTEQSGVVFLNSSVAALASQAQLRALVDQRDKGPAPIVNTFLEKAANIPHDAQVWAISLRGGSPLPFPLPQEGNLANLNRVFQGIKETQAWADLRGGLNANVTGLCVNEQEAKRLGDTLRGLLGLARLSTSSNRPELLRVYDAVQVNSIQSKVEVKATLPEDLLEASVKDLPFGLPKAQ